MPSVMYDSVTIDEIPGDATRIAGYVDGSYANVDAIRDRWPHAQVLTIGVAHDAPAECLDIEPGDSTPGLAPAFWRLARDRGVERPWLYASRDTIPAVIAALGAAGIPRAEYRIWSAHYTTAHICSGRSCGAHFTADATQWTDRALGRNLDESLVADHAMPAPTPRPPARPHHHHRRPRRPPASRKPHRKVVAAGLGAALSTAVFAVLTHHGVHLTGEEHQAIAGIVAVIAGYLTPSSSSEATA